MQYRQQSPGLHRLLHRTMKKPAAETVRRIEAMLEQGAAA
jgi:hypothetical protein